MEGFSSSSTTEAPARSATSAVPVQSTATRERMAKVPDLFSTRMPVSRSSSFTTSTTALKRRMPTPASSSIRVAT